MQINPLLYFYNNLGMAIKSYPLILYSDIGALVRGMVIVCLYVNINTLVKIMTYMVVNWF